MKIGRTMLNCIRMGDNARNVEDCFITEMTYNNKRYIV